MNFAIGKNQLKASGKKRAHWVSKEAKIHSSKSGKKPQINYYNSTKE